MHIFNHLLYIQVFPLIGPCGPCPVTAVCLDFLGTSGMKIAHTKSQDGTHV